MLFLGTREMAQWIKYLMSKHENLNSEPDHSLKKSGNPSPGGQTQEDLWASWSTKAW